MSDITNIQASPAPSIPTPPPDHAGPSKTKGTDDKDHQQAAAVADSSTDLNALAATADVNQSELQEEDLKNIMAKDANLKAVYDKLSTKAADPTQMSDVSISSTNLLISSLINLSQALQMAATAYADRLEIITGKLTQLSKELSEIPTFSGDRAQLYGNMMSAINANKGMQEDLAKKVQGFMDSLKSSSQSTTDNIGTLLNQLQQNTQMMFK